MISPSNLTEFQNALRGARGTAEFAIVVVSDVRGFSEFSKIHESPETALYIKRIYLEMIGKYFGNAKFAKPTGDGLLFIFSYTEDNLAEVSNAVISSCFSCLEEFPRICATDPMINFATPQHIGFGVSRGPTCCLHTDDAILDYSGHLLNLASRLMNIARPSGIVVDGSFSGLMIPDKYRNDFEEKDIFVRSVAEDVPRKIYYSKNYVQIHESALVPIQNVVWEMVNCDLDVNKLGRLSSKYRIDLPSAPVSERMVKGAARFDDTPYEGVWEEYLIEGLEYCVDSEGPYVIVPLDGIRDYVEIKAIPSTTKIDLRVHFAPRQVKQITLKRKRRCITRTKKLS